MEESSWPCFIKDTGMWYKRNQVSLTSEQCNFFTLILRIQIEDALESRWHHPVQPNCRLDGELVTVNKIEIGDKLKLEILFEGEKIYELRQVLGYVN